MTTIRPVFINTRFDLNPFSQGGARRATQLWELLVNGGAAPSRLDFPLNLNRQISGRVTRYVRGWERSRRMFGWPRWGMSNFSRGAPNLVLPDTGPGSVLVIEDTHATDAIVTARRAGWHVLAVPANLESFFRARVHGWSPTVAAADLGDEVCGLGLASAVFCISREEQWLLRGFGVRAEFLPYYPPTATRTFMDSVRMRRQRQTTEHFLLLGFANPANKTGMLALLGSLKPEDLLGLPPILVVGFDTESLTSRIDPRVARVVGGVSDEVLGDLLAKSAAVIVHQEYGPGSLTKLTELLLAGVPVIASEVAARSHYEQSGLHVYADKDEFVYLLRQSLPMPPLPYHNHAAERRFVKRVLEAAGRVMPSDGLASGMPG